MNNKHKIKLFAGILLCVIALLFLVVSIEQISIQARLTAGTIFATILTVGIPAVLAFLLFRSRRQDIKNEALLEESMIYSPVDSSGDNDIKAERLVLVKCPNCGATNKVKEHTVGKCEYCGSPIQGPN